MIRTDKYVIYETSIPQEERTRRELEDAAKSTLIREAFGNDVSLAHDEHGAPYIPPRPDIHISLSHSRDICMLAVSDGPVGIDVENWRAQLNRVAAKFLTPAEMEMLGKLPDEQARERFLLKAWTAKEATFKAAHKPGLVLSEISLTPELNRAEARGCLFDIHYPPVTAGSVIAVAIPA